MIYLILFLISFGGVAIRAFQQLNIAHGRFKLIIPTSYCFGLAEVLLISNVSVYENLWLTVFAIGTGGWMGSFLSLAINGKLKRAY